ncbi:MAG: DUF5723 family protein [Flavobacteriales bacterium]|mgnify:CR=1 FL=1|nr:DUF5723 family protein [Flavobacteriales bacterium]
MIKQFLIVVLIVLVSGLEAQDNLGIAGSTHAPANTVLINPSSICDSRAFIDFNLIGLAAFARNNFAYLPGNKFSLSALSEIGEPLYARQNAPYNAYADAMVHGPSITFNWRQHAFGIYTGLRAVADVRGIPLSLGYYITESFQYREQMGINHTVRDMRANGLGWFEFGGTYSTIINRKPDMLTMGGITIKRLMGIAGVGLRLDEWNYTVLDSSNMETYIFRGEYGFNEPAWKSGRGFGLDLGVTFKKTNRNVSEYTPHSPCTDGSYKYRLGFSLIDIGSIKYKGPFFRNVFDETEQSEWENYQGVAADEVADLDTIFNNNFHLVETNSKEDVFRMKLPTGFSAQLDYSLPYNFYVYGTIMIGLPRRASLGVQRASSIGVAPRYEIRRFEISLPLSLYEFQKPQMGLMLRLNSIIIGSDNLGWMLNQNIYGADIYFNIKYTMFRHWKCKEKKVKKPMFQKKGGKTIPCASW